MAEKGDEIIGQEILRLDAETERNGDRMGKEWRKRTAARREALVWALHVSLTGDRTEPPGEAVDSFLGALRGQEGGTQ